MTTVNALQYAEVYIPGQGLFREPDMVATLDAKQGADFRTGPPEAPARRPIRSI